MIASRTCTGTRPTVVSVCGGIRQTGRTPSGPSATPAAFAKDLSDYDKLKKKHTKLVRNCAERGPGPAAVGPGPCPTRPVTSWRRSCCRC